MATTALVRKISKTTPCKVAWQSPAGAILRIPFDTSGKSPAIFHHRAIRKTQTNLASASGGWTTGSSGATLALAGGSETPMHGIELACAKLGPDGADRQGLRAINGVAASAGKFEARR